MISAVIFDLDGTLTKTASPWRHIHERLGLWDSAMRVRSSIRNRAGVLGAACKRLSSVSPRISWSNFSIFILVAIAGS